MRLWSRVVAVFRAHFGAEHSLLLLRNALDATSSWLKALQGSQVILSAASVSTCLFIPTYEHGSGAFVLTCGCYWIRVLVEYAAGETSGNWYCGEVIQIRSQWMRPQEMEPRLLIRPPSTRCNCWNESAQETREWRTSRTEQVEAVARELATQQATMTHGEVRSRGSLLDVKHVTKQNELSGKTRSNGTMENVVVQDESVLCSSCHKTVLHPQRVDG